MSLYTHLCIQLPNQLNPSILSLPLFSLYKAKLTELVRSEERSYERENMLSTQTRKIIKEYALPAVETGVKNLSSFSFTSLMNYINTPK